MHNKQANKGRLLISVLLICLSIIAIFTLSSHQRNKVSSDKIWKKQWKSSSELNQARRALMAASNSDFIYVLGGISNNDQALTSVEYSAILPTGDLSAWRTTIPLPEARIYAAAVVVGRYLYVIGGGTGSTGSANQPTAKVIRAKILADGQLDAWQQTQSLSSARRGLKVFAHKNQIYAVGGYDGRFLKSTEYTLITADSELAPWQESKYQANLERYIHAAAHSNNVLYVLGGHQQLPEKMTTGDVESTRINEDGSLNTWFIEKSRLNIPRFIASAFVLNRYLYILGGHNGGNRLNSVEFAPIYADGHIGQFEYTSPLKIERSACAVVVSGDYVYVIGGMSNTGTVTNVEMAQMRSNGHLGYNE